MGLAFELGEEGGQRTVSKTGIVSGFHSAMASAPDKGIGVVALSNTGGLDGHNATEPPAATLPRRLLGLPPNVLRSDIPPRPETWSEICGWYSPTRGPVTNLFPELSLGPAPRSLSTADT
jgi:Beta-lactamase